MRTVNGESRGRGERDGSGDGFRPTTRMRALLTGRQLEIVRLAQQGQRPAAIADALCLSVKTVRRTIADACLRVNAHGMPELLAEARRRGLIPPM